MGHSTPRTSADLRPRIPGPVLSPPIQYCSHKPRIGRCRVQWWVLAASQSGDSGALGAGISKSKRKSCVFGPCWGAWGACSKPSRIARARAHGTVLEFDTPAPSAPTAPILAGPSIRPRRGRASAPAWSYGTASYLTRRHFAGFFASGDSAPIRVQAPGLAPLPDAAGGARVLCPARAACVRQYVRRGHWTSAYCPRSAASSRRSAVARVAHRRSAMHRAAKADMDTSRAMVRPGSGL